MIPMQLLIFWRSYKPGHCNFQVMARHNHFLSYIMTNNPKLNVAINIKHASRSKYNCSLYVASDLDRLCRWTECHTDGLTFRKTGDFCVFMVNRTNHFLLTKYTEGVLNVTKTHVADICFSYFKSLPDFFPQETAWQHCLISELG